MDRRKLLKMGTVGAAALAAPSIANAEAKVRWRMATSFPKNLGILYETAELFASQVAELTSGEVEIELYGPGELVGATQVLDAVGNDTIELTQTASTYFYGLNPALAFGSTVPFMMTSRQQNAWYYYRGGRELLQDLHAQFNVHTMLSGNTGTQMGGWYRKEIETPDDLKGLKVRVAGLAGEVFAKAGATPQQIPGTDIYPALERGTIDGMEYIGPFDDEKLGIVKVAPYYYYPGWHEGAAMIMTYVNLDRWNGLSAPHQQALETAASTCNLMMQARFDAENPAALERLLASGAQLRAFSPEVLGVLYNATQEVMADLADSNETFAALLKSQQEFRDSSYSYHQLAEFSFDLAMLRTRQQ
ncbi:TRAP transporter substrate-binding protein [Roseovarius amoyensis]|uniref:TRAP transporter substrate-binding protein n=1 Tax=Roseovarius amoyensis TaxID=2211448 RepID=UPI000DBE4608|nr:TRAP transporter substrate-binding protein DctP [Roseovarius amoyensis]